MAALLLMARPLAAQAAGRGAAGAAAAPAPLTLTAAVQAALTHYPAVLAAAHARLRAAADVSVARTNLWPNAGVGGQWDRGTDNATLGLSFASPFPGISGTVPTADYSWRSDWTSAAGGYFSWELLDFGRRAANVRYFEEIARQAADLEALARLQVAAHAADGYLSLLAAEQEQVVARADVERRRTADQIIHALVDQQLRPGADASRADAELSAARIRLTQADRAAAVAASALAEAMGAAPPLPPLAGESLLTAPAGWPAVMASTAAGTAHPEALAAARGVAAARAREAELAKSGLPRWYALAALYGRGTGVIGPGKLADGLSGLAPGTAGNWAAGLSVDFSITGWARARRQKAAAEEQTRLEQEREREVLLRLRGGQEVAAADLGAALVIARESPVELAAARAGEAQARVRYQAGLANITDLDDAEQLLTQAESAAALADLRVWRGGLESAFAAGDLRPFLALAGGRP